MKILLLHDIRSVYNVGAIFRTADAVGVDKIYMTGYTPLPVDRFKRKRKDFAKAALGSEDSVVWEYQSSPQKVIELLKKDGFTVVAIEQSSVSRDYKTFTVPEKTLVLLGNEVAGIPEQLLEACDVVLEIPMKGMKESLNVSVSAGIVLFRLFDV